MKESPLRLGLTLLIIAGIMGLILGGVNAATKDIIAKKVDEVNRAAYGAVLPEADTTRMESLTVDDAYADRILEIYRAPECGYAFRVSTKGYGGAVIIAVGTKSLEAERDRFIDTAFDVINGGDCICASSIVHAVHSGFDAGLTL